MQSNRKTDVEGVFDLFEHGDHLRQQNLSTMYHFYLTGEIRNDGEVNELIKTLRTGRPSDVINIYINSPGGHLDTCIQLIHAIQGTQAAVVCHADGVAYSGGSLIFFSGHHLVVNPYSSFMMHDASTVEVGKFNEIDKAMGANSILLYQLYHDVYSPYLTDDEINKVLEGKDMYLDAEQVAGRVERVLKEQEEEGE